MEKNRKELNVKELEQVCGGFRTEYLNDEELATYTRLKEAADKAWYPSEIKKTWDALFEFEIAMQDKYGDDIASDEW